MGEARTGVPPRQQDPVARAGAFLPPPMRAWLEQPHGRHHKAPPQPCALTTITPLRRFRLNLSLRLSARHTTRTRRNPRRAPRPHHAHRPLAAPAGQHARSRARRIPPPRVVVVVVSPVVRSGRSGTTPNAPHSRKPGARSRALVKYDPERSRSPLLRTCLVAFVRVDGAEHRPGRHEHFSCLGRS